MDMGTLIIALLVGAGIGLQGALNARLGSTINPIANGLMVMVAGGTAALLLLVLARSQLTVDFSQTTALQRLFIVLSGVLGIVAIAGSTFVMPRLGIVTGIVVILLGQILLAIAFDLIGFSGRTIELSPTRLLGLLLIVGGVWLVNQQG
jgi:bacterial/archaeal transporter family-2 protein